MGTPPSQQRVILLAENKVMMRNRVRTLLQDEGYAVLAAADGTEVIELSRAHPGAIDLVLTDVEMPRVDGISAYRHIRVDQPNMKALFISGTDMTKLELPARWPSLPKAFEPSALRAKLKELLEGRPASSEDLKIILLVDHDADRRERTKNILVENGYAVLTANNVEEAEAVSDSIATIDLIVSGVVFDHASGIHLAEHVEASGRNISTLLISHFHRDLLRDMPGFGRQPEFLPNPFTPEALLMRVRKLLNV